MRTLPTTSMPSVFSRLVRFLNLLFRDTAKSAAEKKEMAKAHHLR